MEATMIMPMAEYTELEDSGMLKMDFGTNTCRSCMKVRLMADSGDCGVICPAFAEGSHRWSYGRIWFVCNFMMS